jgi:hypothetical protein
MKTSFLIRSTDTAIAKCCSMLTACIAFALLGVVALYSQAFSQNVLFDFDNAPIYSSLPIDQTVDGITAHLSATGQGYSIQFANVLGFTPPGFAGRIIYPNSIFLADLIVQFNQTIVDFSIMYSSQELGCDDAATMRVTAYMNGSYVGTRTKTASNPGTWPVDTLRCGFPQGFNKVVVHYDSRPPTCQDYGVIYLADNMRVTPFNVPPLSLDLTSMIEGLWDGNTMVSDSAKVYLSSAAFPFAKVDSSMTVLSGTGNGVLTFSNAATGNYYIVVSHRNSIETWSGFPQSFISGGLTYYDFTADANQAYGSNLILKSGMYCIYSGDVNRDGTIDASDVSAIDNDASNFVSGYVATDLTGDSFVDGSDFSIADNNAFSFVSVIRP